MSKAENLQLSLFLLTFFLLSENIQASLPEDPQADLHLIDKLITKKIKEKGYSKEFLSKRRIVKLLNTHLERELSGKEVWVVYHFTYTFKFLNQIISWQKYHFKEGLEAPFKNLEKEEIIAAYKDFEVEQRGFPREQEKLYEEEKLILDQLIKLLQKISEKGERLKKIWWIEYANYFRWCEEIEKKLLGPEKSKTTLLEQFCIKIYMQHEVTKLQKHWRNASFFIMGPEWTQTYRGIIPWHESKIRIPRYPKGHTHLFAL